MGLIKEFRDFAMRGNVIDMAVGIIIGGAFGTVVKSMVDDVIMPPIGMAMANVNFKDLYIPLTDKITADMTVDVIRKEGLPAIWYGSFINSVISFVIVAFALFMIIKVVNETRKRFEKQKSAAPAAPAADVVLLTEIRDLLKAGR